MHSHIALTPKAGEADRSADAPARAARGIALFTEDDALSARYETLRATLVDFNLTIDGWRAVLEGARACPSGAVALVDAPVACAGTRAALARVFAGRPCVWLLDDLARAPDEAPATAVFLARDEARPAALAAAALNAQRAFRMAAEDAAMRATLQAQVDRLDAWRRALVDELSPLAHGLNGLADIIVREPPEDATAGARAARLLSEWTGAFAETIHRTRWRLACEDGARADLARTAEWALAQMRDARVLGVSAPREALLVACDQDELRVAARDLLASVLDREPAQRRIEVLVWRAAQDIRLAIVTGPLALRKDDERLQPAPALRLANAQDGALIRALDTFTRLGAEVNVSAHSASGATILVALPPAA